jgi:hypothetical protein
VVVLDDQQHEPVILALLAQFPGLRDADREPFEIVTVERIDRQQGELPARLVLVVRQLLLEPRALVRREHARRIVDVRAERRHVTRVRHRG